MRNPDTLKELKGHIDAVNKELDMVPVDYPDKSIMIPHKLHFAIKMLAKRNHKTIQGVTTELLTAGIKATYYKLYMDYMRGPEKTYVDFKKASEKLD
jgi:hypothetical protein